MRSPCPLVSTMTPEPRQVPTISSEHAGAAPRMGKHRR